MTDWNDDEPQTLREVVDSIHAEIEENGSEAVICAFGYRNDAGELRYSLRSWGEGTMALALCPVLTGYVVSGHRTGDFEDDEAG